MSSAHCTILVLGFENALLSHLLGESSAFSTASDNHYYSIWASKVKHVLYSYGFGEHWESQEVTNHVAFIQAFTQRVQDCELQLWSTDIQEMPKLRLYSKFNMTREEELHLSLSISRTIKIKLSSL